MEKLRKYPKAKMLKMFDEYNGPLNHKVFEFLDAVQLPPVDYGSAREEQGYLQIEDHNEHASTRDMMMVAFNGLVEILLNDKPEKKIQIEKWKKTLNERYPKFEWG